MEQLASRGEGPEPVHVKPDSATEDSESTVGEQEYTTNQPGQVGGLSYGNFPTRSDTY